MPSWRRRNQVRPGLISLNPPMTVTRRIRSPGRARNKPLKPLRGECRVYSGVPVVTTLVCFTLFRTRGCGCIGHPAIPAPSVFREAKCFMHHSGASRRGNAESRLKLERRHCEELIHHIALAKPTGVLPLAGPIAGSAVRLDGYDGYRAVSPRCRTPLLFAIPRPAIDSRTTDNTVRRRREASSRCHGNRLAARAWEVTL